MRLRKNQNEFYLLYKIRKIMENLLGIRYLSSIECLGILDNAKKIKKMYKNNERLNTLKNKTFAILFFENSTRTKLSFETSITNLGGKFIDINLNNSSIKKGESLVDTLKTIDKIGFDAIIIRSFESGFNVFASKIIKSKIINAGDGLNEHPTQALLDHFTILEHFNKLKGINLTIIGDVFHSRVARSNIFLAKKLGINVSIYAPNTLIPKQIEGLDATIYKTKEEMLKNSDVLMGLRLQLERQDDGLLPSNKEFNKIYGINKDIMSTAKKI